MVRRLYREQLRFDPCCAPSDDGVVEQRDRMAQLVIVPIS